MHERLRCIWLCHCQKDNVYFRISPKRGHTPNARIQKGGGGGRGGGRDSNLNVGKANSWGGWLGQRRYPLGPLPWNKSWKDKLSYLTSIFRGSRSLRNLVAISQRSWWPLLTLKADCIGKNGKHWLHNPQTSSQSEGYSSKWLVWLVCKEPLILYSLVVTSV